VPNLRTSSAALQQRRSRIESVDAVARCPRRAPCRESTEVTIMEMTWFEMFRLLGLDLLAALLIVLVVGDCVEYVLDHVRPSEATHSATVSAV
jgi:hypothetical protein